MLLIPSVVGGFVDETSGSLSAPDIDLNIQWPLDLDLTKHLVIQPLDSKQSGQYTIQVC